MTIGDIEFLCLKAQIQYLTHTESALFVLCYMLLVKHIIQEGYCADFLSCHDVGIDLCVFNGCMSHQGRAGVQVNTSIQREYGKKVTGGMIADLFCDTSILHPSGHGFLERDAQSLEHLIVDVMFFRLLEPFASHHVQREILYKFY